MGPITKEVVYTHPISEEKKNVLKTLSPILEGGPSESIQRNGGCPHPQLFQGREEKKQLCVAVVRKGEKGRGIAAEARRFFQLRTKHGKQRTKVRVKMYFILSEEEREEGDENEKVTTK